MSRKNFGTTLLASGVNSIFLMIIGIYFILLFDIGIIFSSGLMDWVYHGPLSTPLNIIGVIFTLAGYTLIILYLIFGRNFINQSKNHDLMNFWRKILIGLVIQIGLAVFGVISPFILNPGTMDIALYYILNQIIYIVDLVISSISFYFLFSGWRDFRKYAMNSEHARIVKASERIEIGYKILLICAISDVILIIISFLSMLIPFMNEFSSYIYLFLITFIDISQVIIGPFFILTGQIQLGQELRNSIKESLAEPTLDFAHQYRPQNPIDDTKVCDNCGTPVRSDVKFCPYCGKHL